MSTHLTDDTYVVRNSHGLSGRGRAVAWLIALVLLIVGGFVLMSTAGATILGAAVSASDASSDAGGDGSVATDPSQSYSLATSPEQSGTDLDDAIVAEWDGPTTHLDWQGDGYATAEASFVGTRIVSPGDRVERTLNVENAGPASAVMTVALDVSQHLDAMSENPDLAEHVDLFWDVAGVEGSATFADLLARSDGRPVVAEIQVPQGALAPVTLGVMVPAELTDQTGLDAQTTLSFGVNVRMQGDTEEPLVRTGGEYAALAALALLGLAAMLAGLWFLLRRRGGRCDECDAKIERDEPWIMVHAEDGSRRRLCAQCAALVVSRDALPSR